MASPGCGHCHPMILSIFCTSCGNLLGQTQPDFPCPEWHNYEEPYCLDPAYPGPNTSLRSRPQYSSPDSDDDSDDDNDDFEPDHTLLRTLKAMGVPSSRAVVALSATGNLTVDAAISWLSRRPASPEPDPQWSRWRPVRHCSFRSLADVEAKDWLRRTIIDTVNRYRDTTRTICCQDTTRAGVTVRLLGGLAGDDGRLFTVTDVPIEGMVNVRSREAVERGERAERLCGRRGTDGSTATEFGVVACDSSLRSGCARDVLERMLSDTGRQL